jgi:hypothetical protein
MRDSLASVKLIIGDQTLLTGQTPNLRLDSVRPSTGAPVLMVGLEISDAILFEKILRAAEQRSLKIQVRGKECTTELATKASSMNPTFNGKIILRQVSRMRDIK